MTAGEGKSRGGGVAQKDRDPPGGKPLFDFREEIGTQRRLPLSLSPALAKRQAHLHTCTQTGLLSITWGHSQGRLRRCPEGGVWVRCLKQDVMGTD